MKTSELLRNARGILDNGWITGIYYSGGKHCALGALAAAEQGSPFEGEFDDGDMEASVRMDRILTYSGVINRALKYLLKAYNSEDFSGDKVGFNTISEDDIYIINDQQSSKDDVLDWFYNAEKLALKDEDE